MFNQVPDFQTSKWISHLALVVVITSNAVGNLMLKLGADSGNAKDKIWGLLPWQIVIGMGCFTFGIVVYTWVLSQFELHYVQVIVSLQYVLVILLASWCLGESISLKAWLGIFLISLGIVLSTS